jgi:microcin C transport system substrate-binding protein
MRLTRRVFVGSALALPIATSTPQRFARVSAQPTKQVWRHGLSLFGDVKYPADFAHFDYVNPQAPKGGHARQIALGTFDNFNMMVAGVKGALAAGIEPKASPIRTIFHRPSIGCVPTPSGTMEIR